MKTLIFYYTGTGNSLWVARELGKKISSSKLYSMSKKMDDAIFKDVDAIGLIFPVHIWGIPHAVMDFLEKMPRESVKKVFAIAVNAGQVSRTLIQLEEVLIKKEIELSWGFSIKMPSNYIPWGGPCSKEKQAILFSDAKKKINEISKVILEGKKIRVEKGPWWQRVFFTLIYKMSYKYVPKMDKSFFADDKCNACRICEKICPVYNIIIEKTPKWNNRCEQCFACLQWCPKQAIQYGERTVRFERYHHPDVVLSDMLIPNTKT